MYECIPCSENTISTEENASACSNCNWDQTSNFDNTVCLNIVCEAGTHRYENTNFGFSFLECLDCESGSYSEENSEVCQSCESFSNLNSDKTGCDDVLCAAGQQIYLNNFDVYECIPCGSGSYSESANSMSCESCPVNTVVNEGQTGCDDVVCQPGTFVYMNTAFVSFGGNAFIECSVGVFGKSRINEKKLYFVSYDFFFK